MSLPFVTVIIDTYNYGHFVEEAIDSVLSQNFPADRMEVLVIDDGSTDDTAERVKKYRERIRYFQKENGGQASAFNFGFSRSRGEIICLLDADDLWLQEKLRRVVDAFGSGPVGMVSNNYELSAPDKDGNTKSNLDLVSGNVPENLESLLRYRIFPTSSLAFRRGTLNRLLPMPETIRLQADAYLALLAIFTAPVLALPETLTIYRVHSQNLYHQDEARGTPDRQRRINLMWKTILSEMRLWLQRNRFNTRSRKIRTFLDQWTLYQHFVEFSSDPPTRFKSFCHVMLYNRTYRGRQDWKLTVLNYFFALDALVRGCRQTKQRTAPHGVPHV